MGWESQLLETGFLGIFLCPLWSLSCLPQGSPPSTIVIWTFRWLIFRIMLGAESNNSWYFWEETSPWDSDLSLTATGEENMERS
ncbi:hypothetical protein IHE44_0004086 [Lamprotornis superbus]|uniref:Lipase maturation factor n=1 Tax=Lamprotornis superbus TaxID=245042 RepID=A0A835NH63_9PASS|nr:hypothetical protein IHE44_0004086 [Lamprotornis superbus]